MSFALKITRRLSLKRLDYNLAKKRTPDVIVSFEEIGSMLPDDSIDKDIDERELSEAISSFLRTESEDSRNVFLRKYFFFDTIDTISKEYGYSEGKIKSMLYRTRKRLKEYLKKEGIEL